MSPTLITIIILALIVLWGIYSYNSLITYKNRVEEAWSDIDVQLKRRYDLIPNLIETVKGYAEHEKEVFQNVTEARSKALEAEDRGEVKDLENAENELAGALKSLFAVAEDYPDLKASENFKELQQELEETEDKIQAARRFYNSTVQTFNTKIQQFPTNILANIFSFSDREFFEIEDKEQRDVVEVDF